VPITWTDFPLRRLAQILSKHSNSLTEVIFETEKVSPVDELSIKSKIGDPIGDIVKVRAYKRPAIDVRRVLRIYGWE
jgi:hypothetical protein